MICEKLIEIFRKKIKAGFRAAALGEGVADKSTKRRESTLPAGAIRGATWLGSEGETSPKNERKFKMEGSILHICIWEKFNFK